jgi:hypothetical protein
MNAFGSVVAMERAAEAMLRALGGSEVTLRFNGGAISDDAASNPRLGLGANLSEDVALSPVVVRDVGDGALEFVLPASIVEAQVELRQAGTATTLFQAALGFNHNGKLMRIESASTDFHAGAAYLYRVTARE